MRKLSYNPVAFYILLILGAFLAGISIFNFIILPGLLGRADVVIVPDLRGLSLKQAEERCGERGLAMIEVGRRNSTEIPEGYVMEQRPRPNEGHKEGRAIKVIVSAGCLMESVPDLRNKSLRQTDLLLESAGLGRGRVVRIFSQQEGEDAVLVTSPPAGASVPRSSSVDILLVMGGEPREFLMPNLIGKDLPFVKERLEKLGFLVSRVVSRHMEEKFPNTILDQNPKPGSSIKEGGTIELVVSTVE